MKDFKAPCKAFIDLGSMIECTVLRVNRNCEGHICCGEKDDLVVRVDEDRSGYHKGEIIECGGAFHTPPKKMRVLRGYHYKVQTGYRWVVSGKDPRK